MGASEKKQFNCRPDTETWDRIERVRELFGKMAPVRMTDADLLSWAVSALEKELAEKVAGMEKPKGGKKS